MKGGVMNSKDKIMLGEGHNYQCKNWNLKIEINKIVTEVVVKEHLMEYRILRYKEDIKWIYSLVRGIINP